MTMNLLLAICLLLLCSSTLSFSYETRNHEVEALIAIREALSDPHGVLNNWDEDSVDPCSWSMITCSSDNLVAAFGAPSQGLGGTLSGMIANLTNLKQVLLQNNNISGHVPQEIGKLPNLETLDLSNNKFYGHVPEALGLLDNLQYLRLNNNSFSGVIPESLARVPQLAFLDLSYNNLSGPVPEFSTRTFSLVGNPLICGSHFIKSCSAPVTPIPLSFSINPSSAGYLIWRRSKKKKQSILDINDMQEESLVRLGNLRIFTFKELQHATNNFSSKNILGVGGFGNVYRGKLGDGTMVAVKRLKDVNGTAGEAQFRTELELISLAVHRNLLRLIGYCATPREKLLVYPYMSNGSVASRLRVSGKPALDWTTRKRIAIGAARGLMYLHEQCDPKIIHRDVKAANVLLDDYHGAVVGDFGLAKLLDHAQSHVTTAVRGTVGHIAPEYLSTGQSSEKTDVFGFGILLLELITGTKALEFGKTVHQKGAMLDWDCLLFHDAHLRCFVYQHHKALAELQVKKVQQEKKFELLVDRELGNSYDRIEVGEMLQVAVLCTQYLPVNRPKMSEVVRMLEGDGLAEKWAASHNKNLDLNSNNISKSHNNCVLGHDHDNEDGHLTMFDTMTMNDDYEAYAMELSGPR